jgi:hypothetical protein
MAFVFAALFYVSSHAQSASWITAIDSMNVKISYTISTCNGKDWVFLQLENNSSDSVSVTWDDHLVSGTNSFTSVTSTGRKTLHVGAGKTVTGSCSAFSAERPMCLPLDLYLHNGYSVSDLNYSISGFSKSAL